jgi:hypothetical protein
MRSACLPRQICLLQHKNRTPLYLTPDQEKITIAIVLGDRAYALAIASSLPAAIKKMFSEARPYAEGRGIRFTLVRKETAQRSNS